MISLLSELLALPRCTGCGASGPEWCNMCSRVLPEVRWHRIDSDLLLCTAFQFDGPIRKTIVDWKERQHRSATTRVEHWFAASLLPLLVRHPELVCVPIPSSPANDRMRGARVLHEVLHRVGVPYSDGLVATRARRDQAGLNRAERAANLQDALRWTGPVDRPLLLVDDVVTSGATMRAAAQALTVSGGHVWAAFGLARRGRIAPVAPAVQGLRLPCQEVHHERSATGSHCSRTTPGSR